MINFTYNRSDVDRLFENVAVRANEIPISVMNKCGEIMLESQLVNFEVGGRPMPWRPNKTNTTILVKTGALRDSIHISEVTNTSVVVSTAPRNTLPYVFIHQYGGTAGRGSKIPARPYLIWQMEDINSIIDVLRDFIIQGG